MSKVIEKIKDIHILILQKDLYQADVNVELMKLQQLIDSAVQSLADEYKMSMKDFLDRYEVDLINKTVKKIEDKKDG